ncbi:MAG: guanylate kinase [Sediminibacterium sp.]
MPEQEKKVIILTAPSGAGKTSITQFLLANYPQLAFSVSATTRAPRGAEQDGIDYHFISAAAFEAHIQQDDFLEYEMVYEGLYYGTLKSELNRIWAQGKTPVLDIDVKGAIAIQKQLGNQALSIFILPPSIEDLKERLANRNTESPEKMQMRLDKAEYEISFSNQFNAIVKNEILDTACKETAALIQGFISK